MVNTKGSNALHLACKFGVTNLIERFAKVPGANFNFRNVVDNTTCVDLICRNFEDSLEILLTNGASLEKVNLNDLVGPKVRKFFPVSSISEVGSEENSNTSSSTGPSSSPSRVSVRSTSKSLLEEANPSSDPPAVSLSSTSDSADSSSSSPYKQYKQALKSTGVSLVEEENNLLAENKTPVVSDGPSKRKSSSYFPPSNVSFLPPKDSPPPNNESKIKKTDSATKTKKIAHPTAWIKSGGSDEEIVKVSSAFEKDASVSETSVQVSEEEESEHVENRNDDDFYESLFQFVEEKKIPSLEDVLGVYPDILRDVRVIRRASSKETLIHFASKLGHLDVAQYLVEGLGADVNAVDNENKTPLHYAAEAKQMILVRYLVKYCGALLDTRDVRGHTALDVLPSDSSDENVEEIKHIISKSLKKAPEKRMKVVIPSFSDSS